MEEYREDWDGAWKHILEHHLEALLEWSFPQIHSQIDWSHGQEQLNTELLLPRENVGRRSYVDCLVRLVEKESGQPIILHAEEQGWKETGFPQRVFDYHIFLRQFYGHRVFSILILADNDPHWNPCHWEEHTIAQQITFAVPCLKVLDYREEDLLESSHPAALIILAAQKGLATRRGKNRFERRLQYKQELTMHLLNGLYPQEKVDRLFQSLDRLLALPKHNELQFKQWRSSLSDRTSTPTMKLYTLDRLAHEEGIERGRHVGQIALLQRQMRQNFGILPDWVQEKLESASTTELETWADRILTARTLEEMFRKE